MVLLEQPLNINYMTNLRKCDSKVSSWLLNLLTIPNFSTNIFYNVLDGKLLLLNGLLAEFVAFLALLCGSWSLLYFFGSLVHFCGFMPFFLFFVDLWALFWLWLLALALLFSVYFALPSELLHWFHWDILQCLVIIYKIILIMFPLLECNGINSIYNWSE